MSSSALHSFVYLHLGAWVEDCGERDRHGYTVSGRPWNGHRVEPLQASSRRDFRYARDGAQAMEWLHGYHDPSADDMTGAGEAGNKERERTNKGPPPPSLVLRWKGEWRNESPHARIGREGGALRAVPDSNCHMASDIPRLNRELVVVLLFAELTLWGPDARDDSMGYLYSVL